MSRFIAKLLALICQVLSSVTPSHSSKKGGELLELFGEKLLLGIPLGLVSNLKSLLVECRFSGFNSDDSYSSQFSSATQLSEESAICVAPNVSIAGRNICSYFNKFRKCNRANCEPGPSVFFGEVSLYIKLSAIPFCWYSNIWLRLNCQTVLTLRTVLPASLVKKIVDGASLK